MMTFFDKFLPAGSSVFQATRRGRLPHRAASRPRPRGLAARSSAPPPLWNLSDNKREMSYIDLWRSAALVVLTQVL